MTEKIFPAGFKPIDSPSQKPSEEEVVVAAPASEQPVEEVSETQKPSEEAPAVIEPTPQIDFNELYSKRFLEETGFNTPQELKQFQEAQKGLIKPVNETIARINDFVDKGGTVEEYLGTFQSTDINSLTPLDAIKADYKRQYPSMSMNKIEALVREEYGMDTDGEFESEGKAAKFEMAGNSAKNNLKTFQQENSIPTAQRQRESEMRENQQIIDNWHRDVDQTVNALQKFDVVIGKDEKIEWQVTPDVAKDIADIMKDPAKIVAKFKNPNELATALAYMLKKDQIIQSVASRKKNEAVEEVINKKLINPSSEPKSAPAESPRISMAEAVKAAAERQGFSTGRP